MAEKVLGVEAPKVLGRSFADAFAIGLIKQLEERSMSLVVGNGTFVSGISKLVVGNAGTWGLRKMGVKGKLVDLTQDAFNIDAVEDIVNASINWMFGASSDDGSSERRAF